MNPITNVTPDIELVTTDFGMLQVLKELGLPSDVVTNIEVTLTILDMRRIVNSNNVEALKEIKGIGDKRAIKIIEAFKDKIPGVMSKPCPDIRKPDEEMISVPEMSLVMRNNPTLTRFKVDRNGNPILDENGERIPNIGKKRPGPMIQYLQKVSGKKENIVFTTISTIAENSKDPSIPYMLGDYWSKIARYGIKTPDGRKLVPLGMGTNALMKGQIHWTYEEYVPKVMNWVLCGADMSNKQKIAKLEAYKGLLLPYTKKLLENAINPHMEVITPEWENVHHGKNVLIDPDGTMTEKDTFVVSEFDGQCFIDLTDSLIDKMNLNRAERRRLMRAIAKFNGGTLRGAWHKGVIVIGFHIHDYLHAIGVHSINGKNIDDIALFGDKTIFKAAIGDDGLYKKFEDFADNFVSKQHRFGVLLENHGIKHTFLPAQQLQAAHGADKKFIEEGADVEVEYLKKAQDDPKIAAVRYIPRPVARIAQKDESIMSVWFVNEMATNGYEQERTAALAGRTHGNSVTGFTIKDPIAYCEWIAYCEGIRTELPEGRLNAYEVFVPNWIEVNEDGTRTPYSGRAVASRNPVIANYGLHVVNVINTIENFEQFFDDGFDYIVVSIHDDLCKLLRMDHDGDKMRLTNADWFCKAVESIGSDGVFAEWENFGEVLKAIPTREAILDFFSTCTNSPTLGLNVDTFGKYISNGIANSPEREMVMDYLMNKGTDVKQGANGSTVAGDAGLILREMKKEGKDCLYSIAQSYGKGLKGREVAADKIATEYGDSNLDIISKAVNDRTPTELVFEGRFEIMNIICNKMQTMGGLAGNGHKKQNYEDAGLFNKLVARKSKEWSELAEDEVTKDWSEYQEWKKQEALSELYEFGKANGKTEDDVYDALVTYIFGTLAATWKSERSSDTMRKWMIVLARTFIEWFGDKMEETFCKNQNIDVLAAIADGVDLEEEV